MFRYRIKIENPTVRVSSIYMRYISYRLDILSLLLFVNRLNLLFSSLLTEF